jgi:hypothetical protein
MVTIKKNEGSTMMPTVERLSLLEGRNFQRHSEYMRHSESYLVFSVIGVDGGHVPVAACNILNSP